MKRIFSIAILALFLFNIVGYYGVYVVLVTKANNGLKERLDANNFDEDETITIKVPLAIPYQSDWSNFERVDGEFERDGKFYNLVKQKIEKDTLIVVAVRDHEEASLFESLIDFVRLNTDNPLSKQTGKMIENFAKDFLSCVNEIATASAGWTLISNFTLVKSDLLVAFATVHTPPPRA